MSALSSDIPLRSLGRTGEKVSCIGLGGWHLSLAHVDAKLAERIVHAAIERGVTFMDNCWDYNGGESEKRMGKALRDGRRERVFLMTKIDGRSRKAAEKQLDESLKRLKTDTIDLVLHHGVTFDSVQMPLNVMDAHFRSFAHRVVPLLVAQGIGVLGMKSLANGRILQSKTVSATECLHYALNLPTSTVITGCDSMEILDQACNAARTFKPLSDAELASLLARTADAALSGEFELFKTTSVYDGTAQNPEWLGEEPEWVTGTVQPA